jgi:hypothetical protein
MKKLILGITAAAGLVVVSAQPADAFFYRRSYGYGYGYPQTYGYGYGYGYPQTYGYGYGYPSYGYSYGYPGYGYGPARRHARRAYRRGY